MVAICEVGAYLRAGKMTPEFLKIICECRKKYRIPNTARFMVGEYARCPYCDTPRFPSVWKGNESEERCLRCKIPFSVVECRAKGLCGACYIYKWRKNYGNKNNFNG